MSVHLGPYTFDHVAYDAENDVLYLSIGAPQAAADSEETAEGHIVRYDDQGNVVGVTIVNARWLLNRGETLAVTFPQRPTVADAQELQAAVA